MMPERDYTLNERRVRQSLVAEREERWQERRQCICPMEGDRHRQDIYWHGASDGHDMEQYDYEC